MSRLLITLVAVVLGWAAAAETLVVNSPGDGYLNLRTGPGSQFAIILRMPHASTVETLEYAGNWARVQHVSGATGWAHRRYMVPADPGPAVYRVYSPRDGFLNLRTGPGTRFAVIGRMGNGTRVQILESAGKWVRVLTGSGQEGWAHSDYLVR